MSDSEEDDKCEQPLLEKANGPEDKFSAVYWIMFLFGVGSLLPWNMFITANQYFEAEFADYPSVQKNFENYLIIAAQIPNVAFLFINAFFKNWLPEKTRIVVSLSVMLVMMAFTTILAWVDTDHWQLTFLAVTLTSVVIMNIASAIFQGGVFGMVGRFPPQYRQAVMSGQGLGGMFAALASILSLLGAGGVQTLSKQELETSAIGYFLSAVVIIIFSGVGYFLLLKLPFATYYSRDQNADSSIKKQQIVRVIKNIWPMMVSVALVFFVTLGIFPALSASIYSVRRGDQTCNASANETSYDSANITLTSSELAWVCTYFTPVTCFLLFNAMDFIGRTIPSLFRKPGPRYLLIPVILRLLFIPLYLFCKYSLDHTPFFNSDAAPIVLMIFMGLSNGYLGTLSFIYAPSKVDPEDGETAGALMAAVLGAGLLSGTLFSFLSAGVLVPAITNHLPNA